MSGEELEIMTLVEVAKLLGPTVKPKTVSQYLSESKPEPHPNGKPRRYAKHPFPAPNRYIGKAPVWHPDRADEIREWADTRPGQGVGGGRPRQSD